MTYRRSWGRTKGNLWYVFMRVEGDVEFYRSSLPQSLRVVSHQAPSGWLTLSNGTSVTTSERKIRILRLVRLILTTDY